MVWNSSELSDDGYGIVNVYIEIDYPITCLTDAQRRLVGDYCKKHNLGTPELIEHEFCD